MILRFISCYAGPLGAYSAGEVGELPKPEADRLVKAGYAEPAPEPEASATPAADAGADVK